MSWRARRGDDGTAVIELAPVAFALIVILVLLIFAMRVNRASLAVQDAAQNAAREASIARSPMQASAAAQSSAEAALRADHLSCTPVVTVNTAGFSVPVGQPALVSATVTCAVSLAGLTGVPGIPGTRTVTSTFQSPLDTFRGR
jgi:hypothetical protein